MNIRIKVLTKVLCGVLFARALTANAALPAAWEKVQHIDITAPGIVKMSLPRETLDAARPALEDLRLYDDAGNELPFFIERPTPAGKAVQVAKSFQVSLNPSTTVITLETGLAQPLDGVTLETPAANFIKAVAVEGSADGTSWQSLAQGQAIFRQFNGASQLHVSFPGGAWRWLRLTVDDQRSQPIPFTGARVYGAAAATPAETQTAAITGRDENPGETRITLNLGAANLDVAAIQFETSESIFTRMVTVAVPEVTEGGIRERVIGGGLIYRVAIEGQPVSGNLSVPLETRARSRELILLIGNEDSPPLAISAVRVERRPVYLVFLARQSGKFHLLTGNSRCAAPRYDFAMLGANLKSVPVAPITIPPPVDNPDFRAPEVLPGIELSGAALDISAWKFRKPIQLARGGAQQFELDLDVLAHAGPDLADLRILHGSNQAPYILQRTSISRALTPEVTTTNDAKNPRSSRWIIKLPRAGLPLTRLACVTKTPFFRRDVLLYEELTDERGDKYRHSLADGTWTQTQERKASDFSLPLNGVTRSDTVFLETANGDNPPIELEKFAVYYPATRVLFKAKADDELFLYYGNPRVASPSYDLNLVAGQLLMADKAPASLSQEQQLVKSSWRENQAPGQGGVMLWGVLAVVVVALLIIISRLLPKSEPPRQGKA